MPLDTTIDYDGIKEAVIWKIGSPSLKFLCKDNKPIIIPSLGYDFCQYYVFVSGSEGIIIYGVEKHLKKPGWFVYDEVVASFDESEFERIFGKCHLM